MSDPNGASESPSPSKSSPEKLTFTKTEASMQDRLTLDRNIRFQLFPSETRVVGPVVIIQRARPDIPRSKPTVLLSHKVIFPDRSETVVAVECRALWAGHDGSAFDPKPGEFWKVAATRRNGIITAPTARSFLS
jgi:hypothetical protein